MNPAAPAPVASAPASRHRTLSAFWRAIVIGTGVCAVLLALNKILNLGFFVGFTLLDNAYLYTLCALLVGTVFLFLPAHDGARLDAVPWYDVLLYALSLAVFGYFAFNAHRILSEAWEFMAPTTAVAMAGLAGCCCSRPRGAPAARPCSWW